MMLRLKAGVTWGLALLFTQIIDGGRSRADTTRPSDPPLAARPAATQPRSAATPTAASTWNTVVAAFAGALAEEADRAVLASLVTERAFIRQFNRAQPRDLSELHELTFRAKTLSTRAYVEPPVGLASDLAGDLRAADIPESVKRKLIPTDDADLRRANDTAARWITMSVEPTEGQYVGVIVLWCGNHQPESPANPDAPRDEDEIDGEQFPLFVLVKGQRSSDGSMKISHICYGDPVPLGGE